MDRSVAKLSYCVGLTGGIGSGKSTVAALFAAHGATIVDTDQLAREVVAPGQPALAEIAAQMGQAFVVEGQLDRAAVRRCIAQDPVRRKQLESIVHPRTRALAAQRVQAATGAYVILVVPLLAENRAHYADLLDRIVVVDCLPEQQIARVMQRDGVPNAEAQAMLAMQSDRAMRLAIADDILDNTSENADLSAKVTALDKIYQDFALARCQ
jgi:dephospho-CoA kinase